MKSLIPITLFTCALLSAGATEASSRFDLRKECLVMKKEIDSLRELRRRGGSGSGMDTWKRQLRKLEADYRDRRCKRLGKDFW